VVLKNVSGGILLQDNDMRPLQPADLKVVTKRQPTPEEMRALLFAWKIAKHVKSNAIVYSRDGQSVGIGAGQMSRVDSCRIGAMKAVLPTQGTVAASDAFFPFPDGVEEIAKAALPPSSSQGARCVTLRSSKRRIGWGWRWFSRESAISATKIAGICGACPSDCLTVPFQPRLFGCRLKLSA